MAHSDFIADDQLRLILDLFYQVEQEIGLKKKFSQGGLNQEQEHLLARYNTIATQFHTEIMCLDSMLRLQQPAANSTVKCDIHCDEVLNLVESLEVTQRSLATVRPKSVWPNFPQGLVTLPIECNRVTTEVRHSIARVEGVRAPKIETMLRIDLAITRTMSGICRDMAECYSVSPQAMITIRLWHPHLLSSRSKLASWQSLLSIISPHLAAQWSAVHAEFAEAFEVTSFEQSDVLPG